MQCQHVCRYSPKGGGSSDEEFAELFTQRQHISSGTCKAVFPLIIQIMHLSAAVVNLHNIFPVHGGMVDVAT